MLARMLVTDLRLFGLMAIAIVVAMLLLLYLLNRLHGSGGDGRSTAFDQCSCDQLLPINRKSGAHCRSCHNSGRCACRKKEGERGTI